MYCIIRFDRGDINIKKVSVWLFEKKFVENWSKYEKEYFLDLLKRGVSQLTKLRHPRILLVEKPIEETRCCKKTQQSLINQLSLNLGITLLFALNLCLLAWRIVFLAWTTA